MPLNTPLRLRQALAAPYEHRTSHQHQLLIELLALHFPTLTPARLRLLTFFLEMQEGPTAITKSAHHPHSHIILLPSSHNPENKSALRHPK